MVLKQEHFIPPTAGALASTGSPSPPRPHSDGGNDGTDSARSSVHEHDHDEKTLTLTRGGAGMSLLTAEFESVVDEGGDPLCDAVGTRDLASLSELSDTLIVEQLRVR